MSRCRQARDGAGWLGLAPEVTRTAGAVRSVGTRRSQVPRRRRPRSVIGLTVAAAFAALPLIAATSHAQTPLPDSSIDLLQPSLDGSPITPPRFRRPRDRGTLRDQAPPTGRFTTPSRIGATPVYGSPAGFGAGDTGYDSSNNRRRQKIPPARTASAPGTVEPDTTFAPVPSLTSPAPPKRSAPAPSRPPEVYPARAAARPGAVLPPLYEPLPVNNPPPEVHPLPAANRPGAVVPVPPAPYFEPSASTPPPGTPAPNTLPLGTVPQRPLPIAEGDPYAALGLRAGSFLLYPALELSAGFNSNPGQAPGGRSSLYFVEAPELIVQSDWSRHSLTANIRGSYTEYADQLVPSLNRPYLNAIIDGRIDVSRNTQVLLENRYLVTTDNPGSPNLQAGLARLPIDTTVGGTLGLAQEISRLQFTLKGTFDRSMYQQSVLTDGETSSNDDRNFDQYGGILRIAYEYSPALKPFVEVSEDLRVHDLQFDRSGLQRDSTGTSVKVGGDIDMFGSLTGEIAIGYLQRVYLDPTLPNIAGLSTDGSLIWKATALTTAKLTATTTVSESIVAGTTGELSHDVSLEVDHALRRWLIAALTLGYGRDNYVGSPRQDNRYFVSGGITYILNRNIQLKGQVRQDWLTSSVTGVAYDATSFLLTLRLQR
jgi:hypothetical protein